MDDAERSARIDELLRDPPQVHDSGGIATAPDGVWATDRAVYDLLGAFCPPGARTLETGLGISTCLFAIAGAHHVCVTPSQGEVDRLRAYCDEHEIGLDRVEFAVGPSDVVLPSLPADPLDVLLVDGGHGFPLPIIDWYYAGARLVDGGVLVMDDINLPSVALGLMPFLERDPRWLKLEITDRWAAFARLTSGPLREDWGIQQNLRIVPRHGTGGRTRVRRAAARAKRLVDRGRR